jgi:hypothetical protein
MDGEEGLIKDENKGRVYGRLRWKKQGVLGLVLGLDF